MLNVSWPSCWHLAPRRMLTISVEHAQEVCAIAMCAGAIYNRDQGMNQGSFRPMGPPDRSTSKPAAPAKKAAASSAKDSSQGTEPPATCVHFCIAYVMKPASTSLAAGCAGVALVLPLQYCCSDAPRWQVLAVRKTCWPTCRNPAVPPGGMRGTRSLSFTYLLGGQRHVRAR